jgi:hypothetical protein
MDYRIIEDRNHYVLVREPTQGELEWIEAQPEADHLVWVFIDGALHQDIGQDGVRRLMAAVGVHLQKDLANAFVADLAAVDLNGNNFGVRGKSGLPEYAINDPAFVEAYDHLADLSSALDRSPSDGSGSKPK